MARKAFVTSDMGSDDKLIDIAEENPLAALLWPWLVPYLDDWARAEASPKQIKASVFPMNPLVTVEVIETALHLFHKYQLLTLYEVQGKTYITIPPEKWFKYQTHIRRERRPGKDKMDSSFPPPPQTEGGPPHNSPQAPTGNHGDSTDPRESPRIPIPSPSPSPSKTSGSPNVEPDAPPAKIDTATRPEPSTPAELPEAPKPAVGTGRDAWEGPEWFRPVTVLKGYKAGDHSKLAEKLQEACEENGVDPARVIRLFADYYRRNRARNGWSDPTAALRQSYPKDIGRVIREREGTAGQDPARTSPVRPVASEWKF